MEPPSQPPPQPPQLPTDRLQLRARISQPRAQEEQPAPWAPPGAAGAEGRWGPRPLTPLAHVRGLTCPRELCSYTRVHAEHRSQLTRGNPCRKPSAPPEHGRAPAALRASTYPGPLRAAASPPPSSDPGTLWRRLCNQLPGLCDSATRSAPLFRWNLPGDDYIQGEGPAPVVSKQDRELFKWLPDAPGSRPLRSEAEGRTGGRAGGRLLCVCAAGTLPSAGLATASGDQTVTPDSSCHSAPPASSAPGRRPAPFPLEKPSRLHAAVRSAI